MTTETRSLQDLENSDWGDAPPDATYLIATVHRLRRVPVGSLDVEDLRILIGQQVGVDVLVPIALAKLEQDPLAEGDFYPGDLLAAVLRVPQSYWTANPAQQAAIKKIIASLQDPGRTLKAEIDAFRAGNPE